MKVVPFVIGCLIAFIATTSAYESCRTPDNKSGECIAVRRCEPFIEILRKRPISDSDKSFLQRSQCGFEGSDPKVCCPSAGRTSTPKPDGPIETKLLPGRGVCGNHLEDRIVGGVQADIGEHPWMALVEYEKPDGKGFYCGGVLINERYVLTAAHCVKGKDLPKSWKIVNVRLGEHNTTSKVDCIDLGFEKICVSDPPLDVAVERAIPHEDYDPLEISQYNDIALLRLAQPVKYTEYIKPVCLPTSSSVLNRSYVGKKATVVGWGRTETRSESDVKLKVEVPVKSLADCSPVYSRARVKLSEGQMCAGGDSGKDSCRGDSGGPLMTNLLDGKGAPSVYLIGIVSFGPSPCGMPGWPGIYTDVSKYSRWIVNNLKP